MLPAVLALSLSTMSLSTVSPFISSSWTLRLGSGSTKAVESPLFLLLSSSSDPSSSSLPPTTCRRPFSSPFFDASQALLVEFLAGFGGGSDLNCYPFLPWTSLVRARTSSRLGLGSSSLFSMDGMMAKIGLP